MAFLSCQPNSAGGDVPQLFHCSLLLTVILILVIYVSLTICKKIINRAYTPMDWAVTAMNSVAEGKLMSESR